LVKEKYFPCWKQCLNDADELSQTGVPCNKNPLGILELVVKNVWDLKVA